VVAIIYLLTGVILNAVMGKYNGGSEQGLFRQLLGLIEPGDVTCRSLLYQLFFGCNANGQREGHHFSAACNP